MKKTAPASVAISRNQPLVQDPQLLASVILGMGSAAWKAVSVWSNVDFLLSIREEQFSMLFLFFQTVGWLILLLFAVSWAIIRVISKREGQYTPHIPDCPMLICCGIIAFAFGILIAVRSSGGFPVVVAAYGRDQSHCAANILTSRLRSFSDNYKVAMVCGFSDPSIDKLEDDRVTVSNPFTISGEGVNIGATFSGRMQAVQNQLRESARNNPAATESMWYEAILIPNDVATSDITKLSDVIKHHGKILDSAYFK